MEGDRLPMTLPLGAAAAVAGATGLITVVVLVPAGLTAPDAPLRGMYVISTALGAEEL